MPNRKKNTNDNYNPNKDTSIELIHEEKIVHVKRSGVLDLSHSLETYDAYMNMDRIYPEYNVLIDYTKIVAVDITTKQISDFALFLTNFDNRLGKTAFAVGDNPTVRSIAQTLAALTNQMGGPPHLVFDTVESAKKWFEQKDNSAIRLVYSNQN